MIKFPLILRAIALSRIGVSEFSETKIVKSALNGDFMRTQTGHGYRGKGLPRIYKYVKIGSIKSDEEPLLLREVEGCIRDAVK